MQIRSLTTFLIVVLLAGLSLQFVSSARGQADTPDSPNVTIHVVQRGESLASIAEHYGISAEQITQVNSGMAILRVGQRLVIPTTSLQEATTETVEHLVRAGESLSGIATLYGVTVEQIAAFNAITNPDTIYIGQTLRIPPSGVIQQTTDLAHIIAPGETLFIIAMTYGSDVATIIEANEIEDPALIHAGQEIVIPDVPVPQSAANLPAPVISLDITPLVLAQGQAGRIVLVTSTAASITGSFLNQELTFAAELNATTHTTFVGIPVETASGTYPLQLSITLESGDTQSLSANVLIQPFNYGLQEVELPEELMPLLSPGVDDNERSILVGVTSRYTPERYFNGPMALPATAVMNEPFGAQRVYNEGAGESFHSGADFAALPDTPVMASASGRVVLSDELHIRGNSVVIDHGWGIYTGYAHMATRNVQVGQLVDTGDVVGSTGTTGRSTGAHVHWELWIKGVPVDPMQWVTLAFP